MSGNALRKTKGNTARQSSEGHGERFSRKSEAAILALLAHPTIPEAAKAAGVSETTLWRWLQRDDFQKRYRESQEKVFDNALGALQCATTEAVNCLRRNLNCKNPATQVQAARTILDYTLKAREMFDLENRIAQLEAALKAREEAETENNGGADGGREDDEPC